jgi:hypothetical protein
MYLQGEIFIHVGNFNGEDNYITTLMFPLIENHYNRIWFSVGAIDLGS